MINSHIPFAGENEGTDEFIPFNQIEQDPDKLPSDTDSRLVIYCRSGGMRIISARTLLELGWPDVWNLEGGMISWEASGRLLVIS